MIAVGVLGAEGKVGQEICRGVNAADDLDLVAAFDAASASNPEPGRVGDSGLTPSSSMREFIESGPEVVVDFTVASASRENLPKLADAGIHAVVGTTGLSADDLAELDRRFTSSQCFIAPNFAIGAVLMMKFAAMSAPFFETAEVIELHHDTKADAPSGTAAATMQKMAEASAHWAPDPTKTQLIPGSRGGIGPEGIRVHSVRMRGMVAHQEVILGTTGQTLSIRHDSYSRDSFLPGVLLAIRSVGQSTGLLVGLENFLTL